MKNTFNWFLAIMIAVSVAIMGIKIATSGPSRYSREQEEKRTAIYNQGYTDGYNDAPDADMAYDEGFWDGARAAAIYVEDAQWHTYGEDALMLLEAYFYGDATREEAIEALDWISSYYWNTEAALSALYDGDANID